MGLRARRVTVLLSLWCLQVHTTQYPAGVIRANLMEDTSMTMGMR